MYKIFNTDDVTEDQLIINHMNGGRKNKKKSRKNKRKTRTHKKKKTRSYKK